MHLIETKRLQVRHFSLSDLSELTTILSDPEVMKYSLNGVYDEVATRKFIEWCMECYSSHDFGPWALVAKGTLKLIGFCGIYPELVGKVEEIGLGYRLGREHWGKGFATESSKAVIKYAFTQTRAKSIVMLIEQEHTASIRVAEKTGFSGFDPTDFHNRQVR